MTKKLQLIGRETEGRSFAGSLFSGGAIPVSGGNLYQGVEYFGLQFTGRLFRNASQTVITVFPLEFLEYTAPPRLLDFSAPLRNPDYTAPLR